MTVAVTYWCSWKAAFLACTEEKYKCTRTGQTPWTGQMLVGHLVLYHGNRNNQVTTHLITTVRDCLCASTWLWSHLRGFPVYSSCSSLRAGSWGAMMGCRSLLSSRCVTPLSHHRQLRNTHTQKACALFVCGRVTHEWPQLTVIEMTSTRLYGFLRYIWW